MGPGFDGDLLAREAFGAVLAIAELGADETAATAPDYLTAVAAPFASSEAVTLTLTLTLTLILTLTLTLTLTRTRCTTRR